MHVIGKYIVEVSAAQADGMRLQREISQGIRQKIIPGLDDLFDRYSDHSTHICIDHMEMDIAINETPGWMEIMLQKILDQVEHKLRDNILSGQYSNGTGAVFKSDELSLIDTFFYFLEKGYLPWSSAMNASVLEEGKLLPLFSSERIAMEENQATTPGGSFNDNQKSAIRLRKRLTRMLNSKRAIERLVRQFSDEFCYTVIGFLFDKDKLSVAELDHQFRTALGSQHAIQQRERVQQDRINLLQELILHTGTIQWKNVEWLQHEFKKRHSQEQSIRKISRSWPAAETEHRAGDKNVELREMDDQELPVKKSGDEKAIERILGLREAEAPEEIYIINAGMVVLAPFLPTLFTKLAWMEGNELLEPARAIYLLQYMITGEIRPPEYSLVLNKILCGFNVGEVHAYANELSEVEMREADTLLNAVISHWTVLKSTSIAGLRESFLQRKGKLSRKDEDWLLQVEQRSYDMLLESLPWSISLIRLPFMKNSLYVEWM